MKENISSTFLESIWTLLKADQSFQNHLIIVLRKSLLRRLSSLSLPEICLKQLREESVRHTSVNNIMYLLELLANENCSYLEQELFGRSYL